MTFIYFILFLAINFCYIEVWKKFSTKIPTGIGFLLIAPCFFYFIDQNLNYAISVLILILCFIYFFDDVLEIDFKWRLSLQILAPVAVYLLQVSELNFILILINIIIFFVIINTLNFQDGEDLNLVIILILIFCVFYFYSNNILIKSTSKIIFIFLVAFSFFNAHKNKLYFGDSGCFVVSIILFSFIHQEIDNKDLIKYLIAIIIVPIIDVFYVVIYRVLKGENLLSRNYLHLYQIIAKKNNSKIYLLPNIIFSMLNVFISFFFPLNINFIIILFFFNLILLVLIRQIIQKFSYKDEK